MSHPERPVAGRSFHIVDLENLCGCGLPSVGEALSALEAYGAAAGRRPGDHGLIGLNRAAMAALAWHLPAGYRLVSGGTGANAAERALLASVEAAHLARCYDRVVIGSGDKAFCALAEALAKAGTAVTVVGRRSTIGRALAGLAGATVVLPRAA